MYFSTFVLVLCCSRGCVRLLGLKKLVAIGGTLMVMRSAGLLQLVYLLLAGLLFATRAAGLLSMRGGGCASDVEQVAEAYMLKRDHPNSKATEFRQPGRRSRNAAKFTESMHFAVCGGSQGLCP